MQSKSLFNSSPLTLLSNALSLLTAITVLPLGLIVTPSSAQNEVELRTDGIVVPRVDSAIVLVPVLGQVIYDTNTAGLMYYNGSSWKTICGVLERNGNLIRQKTGQDSDDFVFGSEALPPATPISDTLFFFDKSKGALRGGVILSDDNWAPDSIGNRSLAYGYNTLASGSASISLGHFTKALGIQSIALGGSTMASGFSAIAIGNQADALGLSSVAIGHQTQASGENSTAIGDGTTASGFASTAMGDHTTAIGSGATAMGGNNMASGETSTTMGLNTEASGDISIAMGNNTTASAIAATAMGDGTIASGNHSIAMGNTSTASGDVSSAMGIGTLAAGFASTAMGQNTTAKGSFSTAMGDRTSASGDRSTAMGFKTNATGEVCTVVGQYNDTIVNSGQAVIGISPLFIVGNGDLGNESNAMVVRKDGRVGIGDNSPESHFHLRSNVSGETSGLKLTSFSNPLTINSLLYHDTDGHLFLRKQAHADQLVLAATGRIGMGLIPTTNKLEVEGDASKTMAGNWMANSDKRIKTDIQELENATDILKQLRPVKFKYTDEWRTRHPSIKDHYYYNFIAQEFQEIFPGAVQGSGEYLENDGGEVLQIDTYNAQIFTIAAVKELIGENDDLKKKNMQFEKELNELKWMIKELIGKVSDVSE